MSTFHAVYEVITLGFRNLNEQTLARGERKISIPSLSSIYFMRQFGSRRKLRTACLETNYVLSKEKPSQEHEKWIIFNE